VIVDPITAVVDEVHGHVFTRENKIWTHKGCDEPQWLELSQTMLDKR